MYDRISEVPKIERAERQRLLAKSFSRININEFETADHAMDSFINSFELCDHSIDFSAASGVLLRIGANFRKIDTNGDGRLSPIELRDFAHAEKQYEKDVEWTLCHYDSLAKASLLPHDGVQASDLINASHVLSGLAYVEQFFDSIASSSNRSVYAEDLLKLVCCRERLTPDQADGIWRLIHYLMHLDKERKHKHSGLSLSGVKRLSPESLWSNPPSAKQQ